MSIQLLFNKFIISSSRNTSLATQAYDLFMNDGDVRTIIELLSIIVLDERYLVTQYKRLCNDVINDRIHTDVHLRSLGYRMIITSSFEVYNELMTKVDSVVSIIYDDKTSTTYDND